MSAWRWRAGLGLFLFGVFCPALIPLVVFAPAPLAWKAVISGLLAIGLPEVCFLLAAAILGKEGFHRVKAKALARVRNWVPSRFRKPPETPQQNVAGTDGFEET